MINFICDMSFCSTNSDTGRICLLQNVIFTEVLHVELGDALGYEWQQLQWWTDDEVLSTKEMHFLYN